MHKFRFQLACDSFRYTRQRKNGWRSFLSVAVAIFLALILALLIATIVGYNPFLIFQQLFTQGFVNPNQLIINISILGVSAIAFSFAFKAKLFNIGVSGQMLGAGITALSICTLIRNAIGEDRMSSIPAGSLAIFMLLIAMISGGIIAAVIGALKAYLKVNEVISTIMLNWIIFFVARYAILHYDYLHQLPGEHVEGIITNTVSFAPAFAMNTVGSSAEYGWIAALVLLLLSVVTMFVIFKYTTFGLKIKAVGLNEDAAKYAGFNTKGILVATFTISGIFAGVLAAMAYGCRQFAYIPSGIMSDTLPTEGMDGIAIGLIGLTNPIGILPVAFLLGMFQSAAPFLSVPSTFSSLITGFVMLGASVYVVFANFKPWIAIYEKVHGLNSVAGYQTYVNDNESNISIAKSKLTTIKKYSQYIHKIDKAIAHGYGIDALNIKGVKGFDLANFNGSLPEAREFLATQIELLKLDVVSSYYKEKARIRAELEKHQIISECSTYFYPNLVIKANMKQYDHTVEQQLSKENGRLTNDYLKLEAKLAHLEDQMASLDSQSSDAQKILAKMQAVNSKMEALKAKMAKNVTIVDAWKQDHYQVVSKKENKKALNLGNLGYAYYHNLYKAKALHLNEVDKQNLIDWLNESYRAALAKVDPKHAELFDQQLAAQKAASLAQPNTLVASEGAY